MAYHRLYHEITRFIWVPGIRILLSGKFDVFFVILAMHAIPAMAQWPGTENDSEISIVAAVDEQNSLFATRLIDGVEGTEDNVSWLNPSPWNANNYPMSVILDLGGSFKLSQIGYFVGNINLGTDRVVFEYTDQATATNFKPLISLEGENNWGNPMVTALDFQQARFIRIKFESAQERFNISEVRIFGQENDDLTADTPVTEIDSPPPPEMPQLSR